MKPFWALVGKDLKLFLADRRVVMFTIGVPIMIASFFGSIFGGKSGKPQRSAMAVLVVDLDQSTVSRDIVTNISRDTNVAVVIKPEAEARELVQNGKNSVAVIIPKNFGDQAGRTFFGQGTKPEIGIIHDPSRSMEVEMIKGLLMQHVMQTVSKEVFSPATGQRFVKQGISQLQGITNMAAGDLGVLTNMLAGVDRWMERMRTNNSAGTNTKSSGMAGGMQMPFTTRETAVMKTQRLEYNGYSHYFAGMGVQFILMAAIDLGIGVLLERQRGLWKRLRTAPISRMTLLGSKAVSTTLISMMSLLISFAFGWVVFGVRVEGSGLGFVLAIVAFSLFSASVGLLLAALGMTPGGTRSLAIPAVLMMVMLGGAWIPTFIFPPWLQQATLIMPTRWAIDVLDAMTWRGLGFEAAITPIAVMLGYAVVLGAIAVAKFKWEAE